MSSFKNKLEAGYKYVLNEELDLMCLVLEGRTKLSEVTRSCNPKGYRKEPSNNESIQPWKVGNFQVEICASCRESFLYWMGFFFCLDLFVLNYIRLYLDFTSFSTNVSLFFCPVLRFSRGSLITFSCYFLLISFNLWQFLCHSLPG